MPTKIAIIGAGSYSFTRRLLQDFLNTPALADLEFRLTDIDTGRLQAAHGLCERLIANAATGARVSAHQARRAAIEDADYVICVIRVGGLAAYRNDIEIPAKFGVDQCVGDTLGPGGIFYALRTIPVLMSIAEDMRAVAPGALLLNYANPMAMNCWALNRAGGVHHVGLCHGVQNSQEQIALAFDVPVEALDITAAGINHQTWFLRISHQGRDLGPELYDAMSSHPELSRMEPVRLDVLKRFGYYSTESNGHLSEYLPWYRSRPERLKKWVADEWYGGESGGYLRHYREKSAADLLAEAGDMSTSADPYFAAPRSSEHASHIVEARETGKRYRGHLNIPNRGHIENLPHGCIVELPCFVDQTGIVPTHVGTLPLACAATCRASISVQEMAVEAALTGNRELVRQAVLHDPLTAAVCDTGQVWDMCDALFAAQSAWMPQFNGTLAGWADRPLPRSAHPSFPA